MATSQRRLRFSHCRSRQPPSRMREHSLFGSTFVPYSLRSRITRRPAFRSAHRLVFRMSYRPDSHIPRRVSATTAIADGVIITRRRSRITRRRCHIIINGITSSRIMT